MANTTSDIVNRATRPGNKNWEALKITKKHGNKTTIDQKAAVGNAAFAIARLGRGWP